MNYDWKVYYYDREEPIDLDDHYKYIKAKSKEEAMKKFKERFPNLDPYYAV